MNDPLERTASRAAAAVRERANQLAATDDVAGVRRRARRPATVTVLSVLLLAALAVPVGAWLLGERDSQVDFTPVDPPTEPEDDPSPPQEPEDGATPDPSPQATATPHLDPDSEEDADEADGPEPVGEFGTQERSTPDFPFDGEGFAQLVDLRVGSHDGFDRVVLEFGPDDDVPSYRITYIDPPVIQDGSGDEVAVDGAAILELRMTPASGFTTETDDPAGWAPTYDGPQRLRVGSPAVTEIVRVDDWEANLSWVVGVTRTAPFSVEWLSNPRRLVVDIQHQ